MKLKKLVYIGIALMAGLMLQACTPEKKDSSKNAVEQEQSAAADVTAANPYKGTQDAGRITIDLQSEPPELNSMLTQDNISANVLRQCMAGLTKLDGNDDPQPDLAEKWDISEDKKTYTMHLRKDAKWSNGDPVTAKDYVFSWTTQMTAETGSAYAFILYENIKNGQDFFDGKAEASDLGIKAIDDYTLQIELEAPVPYALYLFSLPFYNPINQAAYEKIGADKYGKEIDSMVVNGPYKIKEWVHEDHMLLEKNPDYYGADQILIPEIKFIMLSDANTRMNAFKAGTLDSLSLTGEQMLQLQAEGEGIVNKYIDNYTWYLQFNTKNEVLSNAKIRQALGLAVDTKSLCDNVFKDGSIPADGYIPTGIKGADGKLYSEARGSIYGFDQQKAKQLFEEGLKELGKTAADIKLSYMSDDTTYGQLQGSYLQQQWKTNLGIDVEIKLTPFKARIEASESGEFDMVSGGWAPDYNDPITFMSVFMTDQPNNYGGYSNPKYDELVNAARVEADPLKRQDMIIEAEKLLIEDSAIAPMYFTCMPYATSAKLEGITRTSFQEYDFCDGAKIVE